MAIRLRHQDPYVLEELPGGCKRPFSVAFWLQRYAAIPVRHRGKGHLLLDSKYPD